MRPARVCVVTIAHGRHEHLAGQHRSLARGSRIPDLHVVVAMGDSDIRSVVAEGLTREVIHVPGTIDALPLAAARNRGMSLALARGAEVVIGLDVDCLAGSELVAGYAEAVENRPDVLWSGPVTYLPPPAETGYDLDRLLDVDDPHEARPAPSPGELVLGGDPDLFWSLSFAASAETWRQVGGFHEEYVGYGAEDTDFGHLVDKAGVPLGWAGSARAYHQYHPVSDPPVEHLQDLLRNGAIFAARWGRWPMTGWFEELERLGHVRRDGDGWAPVEQ